MSRLIPFYFIIQESSVIRRAVLVCSGVVPVAWGCASGEGYIPLRVRKVIFLASSIYALHFAYVVSHITLCQRQFCNTCVYKVHVFRICRRSVTHPILRVFVHPSAKVCGTVKSLVPLCVCSTSSIKATGCLRRPSTCII